MKGEAAFRKLPFTFAKNPLPFGSVENGKLITFLNTLEGYGKSDRQDFFLRRTIKTENKLVLTIFGRKANALVEAPAPITLENFSALVNFLRIDLNFDGKEDYLVQYIDEVKNEKNLVFAFYDENMHPLWRGFQHVKVKIDLVIENITDLNFIRLDHPALGKMMVPTFFTKGQLPKLDQKQDFYGRWDVSKEDRLYYLEPQFPDMSFRIRALTSQSWIESVKKELNSKWFENVLVENMLPVSVSDAAQGRVRVILSVGQGTKRQIFISSFDTKSTSRGKALPQMVIQTEEVDPLYSVTATGLDVVGESYLNVYDRTRSKIVNTKDQTQSFQLNYTHEAETDLIIGQIASFEKGSDKFSVLQTRDELVSLSTVDNKLVKTSRPKLRYSFFSAKVLSEMYVPVIYKRGTEQAPALYVDSTAVTANRVYLFEQQNGRLVSSVRNSLIVPVENAIACKAMNPSFSATTQAHEFTFLCLENKEWFLRTYPMK